MKNQEELYDLRHVSVQKSSLKVLDQISFNLLSGQALSILGPSGSGKTTLLKVLMGIEKYTGELRYKSKDLSLLDNILFRRSLGYVNQGSLLFPHLKVRDNIILQARLLNWTEGQIEERLDEVLQIFDLNKNLLDRSSAQVSGGQKQRVALARALFIKPQLLVLDEPFSALDQMLKKELLEEFSGYLKKIGISVLFVTHSLSEARNLCDFYILLNAGKMTDQGNFNNETSDLSEFGRQFFGSF